jgi:uncharacterized SAM-binding protein YcdF (DUF218 family)
MMVLVDALLSPLGFGLLLGLLLWWRRGRLPRWLLCTALALELLCLLLSTPLGADALLARAERRAPAATDCTAPLPDTIVLLAGGMRRDAAAPDDLAALGESSLQRTFGAATLFARMPGARLVISGGMHRDVAVSAQMAELAVRLGVPRGAIRIEDQSRTTWENATRVRALDPAVPERIWLVTSAAHMPRALLAFRAAGFAPCSYPVDIRAATFEGPGDLLPGGGAITRSAAVLHEWVGEIAYRWRAWRLRSA